MSEEPRETEAKFRLGDRAAFENRLLELGATPGPLEEETNVLHDTKLGRLARAGSALRIRTVNGRGLLTWKGKAAFFSGIKSRVELETEVADPRRLTEILAALGFRPAFTYEKRRTPWRFDESRPLVVIDETPIGLFAEIEGAVESVRSLARELGVSESEFLTGSYVALYLEARRKDPSLPPDMLFPR